ncbi:MAG: TIGR00282 family metallophosphoesterase [Synergistetes bacterium]|nr:TIGR00282 family metallophosphoesterase [Synergistota bacterium]MCX8127858.1 TIGR00282 family metallophosphoesterase [Synergistota bacterium]MDW8192120.1 TIGR00282 family metallophosphoesterase [Synergistota bacterium]
MQNSIFKVLFIGDIVGSPGRKAVKEMLPSLREELKPDLVIANGENSAGGFGLTRNVVEEILSAGVDVITTGNHVWDKKEGVELLQKEEYPLLRPYNYPVRAPGRGYIKLDRVVVVNLQGRIFMPPSNCPFEKMEEILLKVGEERNVIIVDFHAEATSEKLAFAYYFDGKVTAIIGTHTHVPTADERILPGGTAYITDVGMTGPIDSIIGMTPEKVLRRFLTGIPEKLEVAEGKVSLQGVFIEVDLGSLRSVSIQRIDRVLT